MEDSRVKPKLPVAGLLPAERLALESFQEIERLCLAVGNSLTLHERIKPVLEKLLERHLASTSIELKYSTAGDKDHEYVRSIEVLTASGSGVAMYFDYAAPVDNSPPLSLTMGAIILPTETAGEHERMGFECYPNGNLRNLGYVNAKREQIKRQVSWNEDGSLKREETLAVPRPTSPFIIKGPPR
jgi:hypothetical protein